MEQKTFCAFITNRIPVLFATAIFLLPVLPVHAADFRVMVDGEIVSDSGFFDNMVTGDKIVAAVEANRSYCCSIRTTNLADHPQFTNSSTGDGLNLTFPRPAFNGNIAPKIPVVPGHPAPSRTRFCFVPATSTNIELPVSFAGGSAAKTNAWCEETTLVGTYNLVATAFAFLEVSSTLVGSDANHYIRAFNDGATGKTEIIGEFNLRESGRFDQPVHEFVPAGTFSTVFLVHNGPPHSLVASISQYELESVVPFIFRARLKTSFLDRVRK